MAHVKVREALPWVRLDFLSGHRERAAPRVERRLVKHRTYDEVRHVGGLRPGDVAVVAASGHVPLHQPRCATRPYPL